MSSPSRRGLILLGIFCLVPLLNFPRALLGDRTLFIRDISMVWAPQSEAVVQQIGRGEFPFFDGKRAFGQPLFADPRSEILYPPSWIHLLLTPDKSYGFFCALHIVIAALGAARLARRLVPEASLGGLAAAGLAYGAGGPILSLVAHWHHLAAAAWMPWIIELADPAPGRPVPWLGLSGLVALQIFAGSPDYTFATLALCLLRVLTRTDLPPGERFRTLPALLLGLSMSAIQLLPSLAFAREAAREPFPIGWAFSTLHRALTIETILPVRVESWPLRPEARSALLGDDQVWMFSHYLGLSVWGLAALGFIRASKSERRFLGGSVLFGLVLAWGVKDESLQRLVAHLPLIPSLRFPTKHLAAVSLGLSVLAARGAMDPWPSRSTVRIGAAAVLIVLSCAFLFIWSTDPTAVFEFRALFEPVIAITAMATLALAPARLRVEAFVPALVALDLLCAHIHINPTTPGSFFRERPPLTVSIPKGSRIYVSDYSIQVRGGTIRTPPGPPYRLARAPVGFTRAETLTLAANWYLNPPSAGRWGYFGSFDLDILDFYRRPLKQTIEKFVTSRDPASMLDSLRRGSVDYVVTMDAPALWNSLPLVTEEHRFFEAPVRVYRVPGPWPRVRLESDDGSRVEGSPTALESRDGRSRIDVIVAKASNLVLATAYDMGWHAAMDDAEIPVQENGMGFLSVPLTAGHHVVDLVYRPPLLGSGAFLSVISFFTALGLGVRQRRR